MNKIAVATISFTAGAIAGFVVAQFVTINREEPELITSERLEKEEKEPVKVTPKIQATDPRDEDISDFESPREEEDEDDPYSKLISTGPARIAMPGKPGVNYSKVQEIVAENGYTDPEDIKAVIDDPDNEETYEERIEREALEETRAMAEYREKNKNKIVPLSRDEWDTDFPEVIYDHADLHYFTADGILTDDEGNDITEHEREYIGPKPRQLGWMNNEEDRIYIRNHPKETDFVVWKHNDISTDWWG
jgi:hypothetical protein